MSRQRPDAVLRDNKSCWISIDGVDGVGKTVLAQHLAMVLDGVTRVPEFSQSLEDGVSLISASVMGPCPLPVQVLLAPAVVWQGHSRPLARLGDIAGAQDQLPVYAAAG